MKTPGRVIGLEQRLGAELLDTAQNRTETPQVSQLSQCAEVLREMMKRSKKGGGWRGWESESTRR